MTLNHVESPVIAVASPCGARVSDIWLVARIAGGRGNDRPRVAGRNFAVHGNRGAGMATASIPANGAPGQRSPASRRPAPCKVRGSRILAA